MLSADSVLLSMTLAHDLIGWGTPSRAKDTRALMQCVVGCERVTTADSSAACCIKTLCTSVQSSQLCPSAHHWQCLLSLISSSVCVDLFVCFWGMRATSRSEPAVMFLEACCEIPLIIPSITITTITTITTAATSSSFSAFSTSSSEWWVPSWPGRGASIWTPSCPGGDASGARLRRRARGAAAAAAALAGTCCLPPWCSSPTSSRGCCGGATRAHTSGAWRGSATSSGCCASRRRSKPPKCSDCCGRWGQRCRARNGACYGAPYTESVRQVRCLCGDA